MARNCKYHKIETKISYDDGQTWESKTPPVYHMGGLIEAYSQDCETGTTLERWITVDGDYLCDGNNKWTKQLLQNSYDGGVTWYASAPTTFRLGEFVEVDEEYCLYASEAHYIVPDMDYDELCAYYLKCPQWYKPTYSLGSCYCRYIDPIKVVKCSTDTITEKYLSNGAYFLSALKLGECARIVSINYQSTFASKYMQPYLTSIDTTNAVNLETISDNSFYNCSGLTSIDIPNSVTTIGDSAFRYCSSLTSCTIGSGVTSIGGGAFANCTDMTTCTIGNSVTTIGASAFNSCSSLTSIDIPSGVTSIGGGAFNSCSSLTSITVNATTPPALGTSVFYGSTCPIYVPCSAINAYRTDSKWRVYNGRIVSIEPCHFDGKYFGIKSDGTSQYLPCDSNTTLSGISKSNLVSAEIGSCVTTIGEKCFSGCTSLSSVTIDSGVTEVANSGFAKCSALTNVDFIDNLTSIGDNAFMSCYALSSVTTSSGLTTVGNSVFLSCTRLTSVTINGDIVGNTMFYNCTNLRNVSIDNTLSIGDSAFTFCNKIDRISAPSATYIGSYAFRECSGLTSINLPSVTTVGSNAFNRCYYLQNITLPNATTIGSNAFYNCSGLTSINLPSATAITNDAVSSCWNLRNVYLSSVTSIPDYMFASDSYGNRFKLENIDISSVTTIGNYAFRGCRSLTSVTIPSGVTNIGDYAFYYCSGLTSITVNATTPPALGTNAFYGSTCPIYVPCASVDAYKTTVGWKSYLSRIQGFNCPSKLIATYSDSTVDTIYCNGDSSLNWSETSNMSNPVSSMTIADIGNCATNINGAFNGATSLTSVTIPDSVTNIGNNAFYGCSGLTSIDIPSGVTNIGDNAFYNCRSLTSCTIGSGVTSIGISAFDYTPWWGTYSADTSHHYGNIIFINDVAYIATSTSITSATFKSETVGIGGGAFYGCTSLTSIDIPSGVTNIGVFAFRNCSGLTSITVNATTPPALGTNAFYGSTCPIYVPSESLEAYKSATNWSTYASRIQAIP